MTNTTEIQAPQHQRNAVAKTVREAVAIATETQLPRYLNKCDVAELLGVTVRTVDNLMTRGLLPYLKIGGKCVRFRLDDIEKHLDSTCRVVRSGN